MSAEVPAVIVSRASTPEERCQCMSLGEIDKLPRMESPSVLLIGHALDRARRTHGADDASLADKLFNVLMGDAVEPRKNFIQAHAATVQNLDI